MTKPTGSYAAAVAQVLTDFIDNPDGALSDIIYNQGDDEQDFIHCRHYCGKIGVDEDEDVCEWLIWETSISICPELRRLGLWEPLSEHIELCKESELGGMSAEKKTVWINEMANEIERQHRHNYNKHCIDCDEYFSI